MTERTRVPAIVLAGRPNEGALKDEDGAAWEALIPVGGKPMVSHLLTALGGARGVDGGLVVGPPDVGPLLPGGFALMPPSGGMLEHLAAALPFVSDRPRVLVAASDVPLVTAPMVDRFLDGCGDGANQVYFPVVRRETAEARYPGARRTYVRLRDGSYTAGNLFLVDPRVLLGRGGEDGLLSRLLRWRKSPWRMARALGIQALAGLLTRSWDLKTAETRVARRLGITGTAVVLDDPEVGMDVDKPVDLRLCREVFAHAGS